MKTVGELIHSLDKESVLGELANLHKDEGEDAEGYDKMWDELLTLQPKLTKTSVLLSLALSLDEESETWIDISGIKEGDNSKYAIEFTDWREWLSMPIKVGDDLLPMSEDHQLAHCLYEMSWAGYTQPEIQERWDRILDSVEEIQAYLEDESKKLN